MKKIILYTIVLVSYIQTAKAQNAGEIISGKIAENMKDTLSLTNEQQQRIYQINIELLNRKKELWKTRSPKDSLRFYLQKVENERDSLYEGVIPEDKYQFYKQKKNSLISGK